MHQSTAEHILQAGCDVGADFVEIFVEETRNAAVSFKDRKVETATAGTDFGIGLRLLFGSEVLYAHTSSEEEGHLLSLITALAATRSQSPRTTTASPSAVRLKGVMLEDRHVITADPRQVGQQSKLEFLRLADITAREISGKVSQVAASASDVVSQILIANSEGLWVNDTRTRCRFTVAVTAESGGEIFVASETPGALRGFEFFTGLDIEALARTAAERALLMLTAGYIKGGKMPVVMGNGFGGVIFHEACGHLLETDALRRKATPFAGKVGSSIANAAVTAIDDGTIANAWGSLNIDDEGMPVQKTTLIENGVLKAYMSDRVGALETGAPRTGSGRRESYQYAPVSRMRNTYIAPGHDRLEDMLGSVDEGLYARKMGGGSVNPSTGEFNFAVAEGWLIRDGKITEPVRGATLIGKGPEILPLISMVGSDLELATGMCGAASGQVPVTVGQPSIKVDSILVGGR